MDRGGYACKTFNQVGARSVEKLVRDAEDAAFADGAKMVPVALGYDLFEGNAISGPAPGKEKDIGISFGYSFWSSVGSGLAEESTTGDIYQFGDPLLGVDEGLAPLLAVDDGGVVSY